VRLGEHQEAFARDYTALLIYALQEGYQLRLGEVQRPIEMQQMYVRMGRSKTMNSMHIKKCAADVNFTLSGELCYPEKLGKFWESLNPLNQAGMFWEGFKDSPHFQRTC
jgi:peptidoglycan L-alanyl-D-glutamate endopeptidase CwlK